MKKILAGLLFCIFSTSAVCAAPPNVIVILLDDMGYSDFGCYGGEIRTPGIDALAKDGLRFRNFYNTGRCSPTRIALMTGSYSQSVCDIPEKNLPDLRTDNNITIAEFLKSQGYRTYMAGKWHLGVDQPELPWNRGFDHVFGFGKNGASNSADPWNPAEYRLTSKNGEIKERAYGTGPYDFYQSDAIADYGIDFIDHSLSQNDRAPFFIYLAFRVPHSFLQAPKSVAEFKPVGGLSYIDLYRRGWDAVRKERYARMETVGSLPAGAVLSPFSDAPFNHGKVWEVPHWDTLAAERKEDLAHRMAIYAAMVECVDTATERMVKHLKETGQFDNTLIFVMSDNGCASAGGVYGSSAFGREPLTGKHLEEMGQPFVNDKLYLGGGWANVANTPYRYYKRYTHGGGTRTPLVVSWPAGIGTPGQWVNQAGHVMDILPTIAAVCGAEVPSSYAGHDVAAPSGKSLLPAFNSTECVPRKIGFEHEGNRAWIDGDWKFVSKNFASVTENSPADMPELYNLKDDPCEQNNLASEFPERLDSMMKNWDRWAVSVGLPAKCLIDPAAAPVVSSPVLKGSASSAVPNGDPVEEGDWTLVGGAGSFDRKEIKPSSGQSCFNFSVNPGKSEPFNNRAAVRDFGTVLQSGKIYTVRFDVACSFVKRPFIADAFSGPVSDQIAVGWFRPEGISFAENSNSERQKICDAINAVLKEAGASLVWESRTVPEAGEWQTWSYRFSIPKGSPLDGARVCFGVYGGHTLDGKQRCMAFDNLHLSVQPAEK